MDQETFDRMALAVVKAGDEADAAVAKALAEAEKAGAADELRRYEPFVAAAAVSAKAASAMLEAGVAPERVFPYVAPGMVGSLSEAATGLLTGCGEIGAGQWACMLRDVDAAVAGRLRGMLVAEAALEVAENAAEVCAVLDAKDGLAGGEAGSSKLADAAAARDSGTVYLLAARGAVAGADALRAAAYRGDAESFEHMLWTGVDARTAKRAVEHLPQAVRAAFGEIVERAGRGQEAEEVPERGM